MNLRIRRQEIKLTQTELARLCSISQSIVSDYENGQAQMTAENIIRLAVTLRCTTDYLLGLSDEPTRCREITLV